jgi:hypothetical protein
MAEGIVYLDVDDEITSAAQRIRSAPGTKVALVVPYGSRIATSRMNFRLLSREALVSNRRLSIVSGDAAARSLAASAGLPVFGTVGEYETSLAKTAADRAAGEAGTSAAGSAAAGTTAAGGFVASETVAAIGPAGSNYDATDPAESPSDAVSGRKSQRPKRPPPDETPTTTFVAADEATEPDAAVRSGGRSRAPLVAAAGLIGLAVVVLAVAAYLFVPSATIALTPRRDAIGPIQLTVSADPNATEVDVTNQVVPAVRLDVPVEAARTFSTTGIHIEETGARGTVTFTNYDTSSGVSIPSGSIVSTESGVGFRTVATVALQPASVFPSFQPTSDSVSVRAAKTGEGGNVPANTIRVVPQGQDPVLLRVNNPDPTTGGTHTETPEVTKAEVDKAVAALQVDLGKAFTTAIAAGAGAPADTKLFPDTALLGPSKPDPDPKTIVGKATATFDLKLRANGTVIAVDPRPVTTIARTQLQAQVAKDHRLVADSVVIDVGDGTVGEDGEVTFLASARATQVAMVDANALRSLVKGKTAAEAQAALVPYGSASVSLWPSWVSTVTGVDARLTLTVEDGTPVKGGASASPASAPTSSPRRSGGAASPVASGSPGPSASAP